MKRSLAIERLFTLGEFQNVKFIEELNDIPEELALDEEALEKLRYLLLLDVEISFRNYAGLKADLNTQQSLEETINYLKNEQLITLQSLTQKSEEEKEI